jgi:hypothetical protein
MSKETIEHVLDGDLNLEAATCYFIDYVCGKLDAYLEDEDQSSTDDDYYEAICRFGDGSIYELSIGVNEETGEWECEAIRKRVGT